MAAYVSCDNFDYDVNELLIMDKCERIQFKKRLQNRVKGIGRFWKIDSMCFLSSDDKCELESFQMQPLLCASGSSSFSTSSSAHFQGRVSGGLNKSAKSELPRVSVLPKLLFPHLHSPVMDVINLHQICRVRSVLVVCQNGTVLACWIDNSRKCWLHEELNLIDEPTSHCKHQDNTHSNATLVSASLHDGHGYIYWCEEDSVKSMCSCFRRRISMTWSDVERIHIVLGNKTSLFDGGIPHAKFVRLHDYMLIWFPDKYRMGGGFSSFGIDVYFLITTNGKMSLHYFGYSGRKRSPSVITSQNPGTCTKTFVEYYIDRIFEENTNDHGNVIHLEAINGSELLAVVTSSNNVLLTDYWGQIITIHNPPNINTKYSVYFSLGEFFCIANGDKVFFKHLKDECPWKVVNVSVRSFSHQISGNSAVVYLCTNDSILSWTPGDLIRYGGKEISDSQMQSELWMLSQCDKVYNQGLPANGLLASLKTFSQPPIRYSGTLPVALFQKCLNGNVSPSVAYSISQDTKQLPRLNHHRTDLQKKVGPLLESYFVLQEYLEEQHLKK